MGTLLPLQTTSKPRERNTHQDSLPQRCCIVRSFIKLRFKDKICRGNMKKIIFAMLVLSLVLVSGCAEKKLTEEESCSLAGGQWILFSNGCVDMCSAREECTHAFKEGCDCGSDKCWNGTTCVLNPKKAYAAEEVFASLKFVELTIKKYVATNGTVEFPDNLIIHEVEGGPFDESSYIRLIAEYIDGNYSALLSDTNGVLFMRVPFHLDEHVNGILWDGVNDTGGFEPFDYSTTKIWLPYSSFLGKIEILYNNLTVKQYSPDNLIPGDLYCEDDSWCINQANYTKDTVCINSRCEKRTSYIMPILTEQDARLFANEWLLNHSTNSGDCKPCNISAVSLFGEDHWIIGLSCGCEFSFDTNLTWTSDGLCPMSAECAGGQETMVCEAKNCSVDSDCGVINGHNDTRCNKEKQFCCYTADSECPPQPCLRR
jgi:hypothetical protein